MKVSTVDSYALSSPINPPQDRSFRDGRRRLRKRDFVLVVVHTADGERGVAPAGASNSALREYFEGKTQETFADVLASTVAPALEGESVDGIDDVHHRIDTLDLPPRIRTKAISALDVALYDILGKRAGAPIYELLADTFEEPVTPTTDLPLYASAGMYMEPEGYADQAALLETAGFFGYKYRPGIGLEEDRRTIDLLTDSVDEMEIMIDAHTWWKLRPPYRDDAVRDLVSYAADRDVFWVEEPVAPDDYDGYRTLAPTGTSLAGGENEESPEGLLKLEATEAVSYLQGDVRHHRGFTGCGRVIEFCRDRNVEFVPHNFGTWLGLVANAHLVAAGPGTELLEYPVFENDPLIDSQDDPGMYPFDLAFDIIEGEPSIEDGRLRVPTDPGLGVEVNLDVVNEYPFIEGPWTEFHYDDSG